MRKAYRIAHKSTASALGVVFSVTRQGAKWTAIRSYCDAFNVPVRQGMCGMSVRRAPDLDPDADHHMPDKCYTEEYIRAQRETPF